MGLFAWTCLTYAPVVHHDFVNFDDLEHVVHNPNLTRPPTLVRLPTRPGLRDADACIIVVVSVSGALGAAVRSPTW